MPRPSNLLAGVASQQHAEAPANEVPGQARDDVKDEPTRVTGVLVRPVTGVLVHPVTGVLVRPVTGVLVHPVTGVLVHPVTGVLAHPVIPANAGISNTSRRPATQIPGQARDDVEDEPPVTGVLVHPVTRVLVHPVIPANAGISNTSRRPATGSDGARDDQRERLSRAGPPLCPPAVRPSGRTPRCAAWRDRPPRDGRRPVFRSRPGRPAAARTRPPRRSRGAVRD